MNTFLPKNNKDVLDPIERALFSEMMNLKVKKSSEPLQDRFSESVKKNKPTQSHKNSQSLYSEENSKKV